MVFVLWDGDLLVGEVVCMGFGMSVHLWRRVRVLCECV